MIKIFSYKRKNKEQVIEKFNEEHKRVIPFSIQGEGNLEIMENIDSEKVHELTSFIKTYDKNWESIIENIFILIGAVTKELVDEDYYFLVEQAYFIEIKSLMDWNSNINFFSAEKELGIETNNSIISMSDLEVIDLNNELKHNLIGNDYFKFRLIEELKKFRLFYILDEQKIFSCLLFGESGIGKTETARILSNYLSPNEKMIKINLGNYSGRESLSSLIGSPRGFIGSQEGELSAKIFKSNSKVILIDEFEKSDTAVHNFFLELLEDGKFTDSLGREFDLSEYIFIFTTNVIENEENKYFSPELLSRFNLLFRFSKLSLEEKSLIVHSYEKKIIYKIMEHYSNLNIEYKDLSIADEIDLEIDNIRDIKDSIKLQISNKFFNNYIS
ncbi:AAA family ATPase [Vagococcus fluvialis]|uniref:AAA family ATPase n=1 Tax=Vagococcus fluvialis TaxID=2738 RepID=UPI003B5A2819